MALDMDTVRLQQVKRLHREGTIQNFTFCTGPDWKPSAQVCMECGKSWPCPTIAAATA